MGTFTRRRNYRRLKLIENGMRRVFNIENADVYHHIDATGNVCQVMIYPPFDCDRKELDRIAFALGEYITSRNAKSQHFSSIIFEFNFDDTIYDRERFAYADRTIYP